MKEIHNEISKSTTDEDITVLLEKEEKRSQVATGLLTNAVYQDAAIKSQALDNSNTADARQAEVAIANSNASWVTKNVHSIIAIGIVLWGLTTLTFILFPPPGVKMAGSDILFAVITILTNLITAIVSYYFGSSSSSQNKDKLLSAAINR
jgi:hypothetical protein